MEGQAGVKQDMQHAADVLRRTCDAGCAYTFRLGAVIYIACAVHVFSNNLMR